MAVALQTVGRLHPGEEKEVIKTTLMIEKVSAIPRELSSSPVNERALQHPTKRSITLKQ